MPSVQLDLDGPDVGERAGRRRGRPAGPPLQVGPGAGAERAQPQPREPGRGGRACPARRRCRPGIQSVGGGPPVLAVDPRAGRPGADDVAGEAEHEQQPGVRGHGGGLPTGPDHHRERQLRQAPAQVPGGRRAVGQQGEHGRCDRPRSTRRDRRYRRRTGPWRASGTGRGAGRRWRPRARAGSSRGRRPTACGASRGGGAASGRRRAPSRRRRASGSHPGEHGQVDGDGVAGVQRDEVVGDRDDVVRAPGRHEPVPHREPGAALGGVDAAGGHGASLPDGARRCVRRSAAAPDELRRSSPTRRRRRRPRRRAPRRRDRSAARPAAPPTPRRTRPARSQPRRRHPGSPARQRQRGEQRQVDELVEPRVQRRRRGPGCEQHDQAEQYGRREGPWAGAGGRHVRPAAWSGTSWNCSRGGRW